MLIIRSPRASPAFKCEYEISSTLSSYIFFTPRRIKGGVNHGCQKCFFFSQNMQLFTNYATLLFRMVKNMQIHVFQNDYHHDISC